MRASDKSLTLIRTCAYWRKGKSMAGSITVWQPCTNATAHPQRAHRRTIFDRSDIVLSLGTCKPHRQVRRPDTIARGPRSRLLCHPLTRHTSCRNSTRVSLLNGTVRYLSDYAAGLNGWTQHSARTQLPLITSLKSLVGARSTRSLPWLGFDRRQPNRSVLSGKPCRMNLFDGVASTV
jgi:hypothetical protein